MSSGSVEPKPKEKWESRGILKTLGSECFGGLAGAGKQFQEISNENNHNSKNLYFLNIYLRLTTTMENRDYCFGF